MDWRVTSILPSVKRLRLALLFVVLAATGAQQFIAQTHWHALPGGHARVVAPSSDSGSNSEDGCLLCQIASHAGTAAPPVAVLPLFTSSQILFFYVASSYEADVPAVPAHAWQSRGPPARLTASFR